MQWCAAWRSAGGMDCSGSARLHWHLQRDACCVTLAGNSDGTNNPPGPLLCVCACVTPQIIRAPAAAARASHLTGRQLVSHHRRHTGCQPDAIAAAAAAATPADASQCLPLIPSHPSPSHPLSGVSRGGERALVSDYRPYLENSQSRLSRGHTCRVFSHRLMQWKWNAWSAGTRGRR